MLNAGHINKGGDAGDAVDGVPQAEALLAAVVGSSDDAIITKTLDGIITSWNASAERIFGYSAPEMIGQSVFRIVPTGRQDEEPTIIERLKKGERVEHFETVRVRKDGSHIDVSVTISPLRDAAGVIVGASNVARDISDRRRSDEAKFHLAAVIDSSDDAIVTKTLEGIVTSWNPGAARIFGYSEAEMVGTPLMRLIPEDRLSEEAEILRKIRAGERVAHFETIRRRKDGCLIHISATISPIRNGKGDVVAASKVARDVTKLKLAQQEIAEAKEAAERSTRELDAFSSSVAHDLRAPLRRIDGFSLALLEDYQDKLDQQGKEFLEFVRESATHMGKLIDDLLGLARMTRVDLRTETVDMSALAHKISAPFIAAEPSRKVELVIAEGMTVAADAGLMSVALENLLSNAWKFTRHASPARIEFGRTKGVFFVRDNGAGFDMAYASKLFGIFQRQHSSAEFEGTGVGLATVERIVRRHGGRIWAGAAPGQGATFQFTIGEGTL